MSKSKPNNERVAECVQIRRQLQALGVMSDRSFASQLNEASRAFMHQGVSSTFTARRIVDAPVDITVVLSNTHKSGIFVRTV